MATQAIKLYKNSDSDTDKRVGINLTASTNPEYTLDVNGSLRITTLSGFNNKITVPLVSSTFGQSSSKALFQFVAPTTGTPFIPAFMFPSKVGSWALATNPGSNEYFYFVYNNGGGTGNDNTRRYYLDPSNGNTNTSYKILTTAETVSVGNGGTGATTFTSGALLTGNGTSAIAAYTPAWQAWTGGTTAGPKAKIKLGNVDYESAAIPAASSSASGIVTTGNQTFAGRKTMALISPSIYDGTGNTSRYKHLYFRNNAGTMVGEVEYDSGDVTNVSGGTFWFTEMSPKSTADTATTGYYEAYALPTVTTGRTTNASYRIITTKGGTMPARFSMYQSYQPYFVFKPSNSTNNGNDYYGPASIWVNSGNSTYVNQNTMYFRLYSPSKNNSTTTTYTSYYDQFTLPDAEVGRTESGSYDILTTKNTVTIAQGGTGATTRLNALKALTNENVGTSATYFLTITDSWGKGGYSSVANAKTVLGLGSAAYLDYSGTIYGSGQMGWKKVSITLTNGAGSVECTGVTADSVVQAIRVGKYSDTSGGYSTHIGAAATNAGNVKVFSTASGTVTWSTYLWWSKTATGG